MQRGNTEQKQKFATFVLRVVSRCPRRTLRPYVDARVRREKQETLRESETHTREV